MNVWDKETVFDMVTMSQDPFDLALIGLSRQLRAYFGRRICDSAVIEDLTQETLLKAFRSRRNLRDLRRVEPWVYRIAHFTAVDFFRKKNALLKLPVNVMEEPPAKANQIREVLACSARCYLGTLPSSYRVPVQLADCDGLSHRHIAQRLGLSLSATKARIRRGKIMVRNLMEAHCEFQYDPLGNVISYEVRCAPVASAGLR